MNEQTERVRFILAVVANKIEQCVIWPYGVSGAGYGILIYEGRQQGAHRVALKLLTGEDHQDRFATHGPCHERLCVNPRHLSWSTPAENTADRKRDGTEIRGEKHGLAKLIDKDILSIRADSRSQRAIASAYGVSQRTIGRVTRLETWTHIVE